MPSRCWRLIAAWILACATQAGAASAPARTPLAARPASPQPTARKPAPSQPDRLEVTPPKVTLDSRRAYRQLIVTGYFHGEARDLTRTATYQAQNERVVRLGGGRVMAAGNGRSTIAIRFGGRLVQMPVVVANITRPDPVQFAFETLPALTKQGCASGSCHGSPHGKGGFSLSLFGYDPRIDRVALTRDGFNRRVNVLEPTESLLLKKPLLEIPHVGGKRLHKTDAAYRILQGWIYEGAHVDLPRAECQRIVITPNAGRVLHAPDRRQQLSVLATFTDGTARDVTAIATYESSHPSIATVDADGLITGLRRGQAAISVRYLDKLESVYITVVEDVPGFAWNNPPENNVIDTLVDEKLKQLQYLPSQTCSDAVFLRRLTLDLTGLLPTPEQARLFLKDPSPGKRAKRIDALLETEDFARFWALKQADLMRVSPKTLKNGRAERFARWIVDAVRQNLPYDQFAREILTATGDTEKVASANYFLAIPTMEERTEMTAQLFMGSRLECAKCHNHPFENWTMRDYYRIAAVFARTQTDKDGAVKLVRSGEALHPTTGETMIPWGAPEAQKQAQTEADRRVLFAAWLTRPGNPYFARVAINRIWADLMGRGIVEPVDDFRSSNPPANVPLLSALAQEFEKSGYDRKRIIRLICNSRTYQRSGQTNRFNETEETLFSHARVRLLTAEQLKDAIGLTTQALQPTSFREAQLADLRKQADARAAELETKIPAWLQEAARRIAASTGSQGGGNTTTDLPPYFVECLRTPAAQRTAEQRRFLRDRYLEEDSEMRALQQQIARLDSRMEYATQRPYPEASPFTVTFGQPQRTTACTCERQQAPTLLQALELLNGGTAYQMAQSGAGHYASLANDRLMEELYLSALCRFPTDRERATAQHYLEKAANRDNAVMDLIWTVINTQEFLFQH